MNILNNWLVQFLAISLVTYPCLGCAPATSPCGLTSTIPRSGITGLNADCDGAAGSNPGTSQETCTIPNGESFTVAADACDTGTLTGRPIVLDATQNTVTQAVDFTCSGNGQLAASSGGTQLDSDVDQADCLSSLSTSNCAFTLSEVNQENLVGDTSHCDNANNCWVPDGAQFTIAADVCARNSWNRPLRLNNADNPATLGNANVATTYQCRNGALQATSTDATFTTVADVSAIECANQCVLTTAGLTGDTTPGITNFGTCGGVPVVAATCVALVGDTATQSIVNDDICAAGEHVAFMSSDTNSLSIAPFDGTNVDAGTAGDLLDLSCLGDGMVTASYTEQDGGVGSGTLNNVYSIGCQA